MLLQMTNQDNKQNQNLKVNRLDGTPEMQYVTKRAKQFDRVEDRAKDLGIATGTYRNLIRNKYCNWVTLDKIRKKIEQEKQAS